MTAPTIATSAFRPAGARSVASDRRAAAWPAWRWVACDVLVWAAVALLFAAQEATRSRVGFGRIFAGSAASFVPCALFTPAVAWTSLRHRFQPGARGRSLAAHGAMLALFLTLGSIMMAGCLALLPWARHSDGLVAELAGSITRYFAIDAIIYVSIAAAAMTWGYARDLRDRELRAATLQAQLADARLHALGSQLQPHFLFNTLHVISALVRHDPRRAEQLIARLSELLREMLDSGDRMEVPLREELRFLEKYADIQEARFGPRLRISFDVAPDVLDAAVPRLVLQPLVENAVRHGLAPRSAAGTVVVRASCAGERLTLEVRDDGVGVAPGGPAREGVGLATTRARLEQLYGDSARFSVAPIPVSDGGGTVCTIELPCRGALSEGIR